MGARPSSCPGPWVEAAASKSVLMFSFSFLIRKSLGHSGRFGKGESKQERKALYPGIRVEGGTAGIVPGLCARLLSGRQLSGVDVPACW